MKKARLFVEVSLAGSALDVSSLAVIPSKGTPYYPGQDDGPAPVACDPEDPTRETFEFRWGQDANSAYWLELPDKSGNLLYIPVKGDIDDTKGGTITVDLLPLTVDLRHKQKKDWWVDMLLGGPADISPGEIGRTDPPTGYNSQVMFRICHAKAGDGFTMPSQSFGSVGTGYLLNVAFLAGCYRYINGRLYRC